MALRSLNNPIASFIDYLAKTGTDAAGEVPPGEGLTATGGVISDYVDGSDVYRAHIFTSSGTFTVSSIGSFGSNVEMLLIGGGGGGGAGFHSYAPGAGGGGGGWVQVTSYPISTTPGSYPISVGAGGVGGRSGTPNVGGTERGTDGTSSTFTNPSPQVITAAGGGGAGGIYPPSALATGNPGGSGGGGGYAPAPPVSGGTGTQPGLNPGVSNITQYGFDGGTGDTSTFAGGGAGGGAGGTGTSYSPPVSTERSGGSGRASVYAYGPTNPTTYAAGGPANGPQPTTATNATQGTGDGGMASRQNIPGTNAYAGGSGGSGIVVVRYQIGQLTAVQKATGGAISYYNGKTIHVFTSSGTFETLSPWTGETVEYVVVGGGGAGGNGDGGGGGAGAYRTGTTPIGAHPVSTTIQVGAGGFGSHPSAPTGGNPSYFGAPITSPGGGSGGSDDQITVPAAGGAGGSGGGGGGGFPDGSPGPAPGATPFPGTIGATPPTSWWGHAGGEGRDNVGPAPYSGGGGGGAGGAGATAPQGNYGGVGVQLPTTFRNPEMASGNSNPPYYNSGGGGLGAPGPTSPPFTGADTSGKFWVAGGGGGARINPGTASGEGQGGGGGGGWGGGPIIHPGTGGNWTYRGAPGAVNTGGGGGGGDDTQGIGGNGGSGIVLIAYPS